MQTTHENPLHLFHRRWRYKKLNELESTEKAARGTEISFKMKDSLRAADTTGICRPQGVSYSSKIAHPLPRVS